MKKHLMFVGFVSVVLLVSGLVLADQSLSMRIGDNIFRIQAGAQPSQTASNRELEQRIWMLERAVNQLQNQVFRLSDQGPREAPKTSSCYLKTSLKGTFTGSGASKTEAKGKALKACTDAGGGIFCDETELRCDD